MIYELVKKSSYACYPKNVNYKLFATEPSVKLPLWIQAYEWKKDAIVKQLNETDFYVSSTEGVGGINQSWVIESKLLAITYSITYSSR